jgi:hypothetical protein
VKDAFAYHLVWRLGSGRRPAAQAFAAWIGVRLAAGAA